MHIDGDLITFTQLWLTVMREEVNLAEVVDVC